MLNIDSLACTSFFSTSPRSAPQSLSEQPRYHADEFGRLVRAYDYYLDYAKYEYNTLNLITKIEYPNDVVTE